MTFLCSSKSVWGGTLEWEVGVQCRIGITILFLIKPQHLHSSKSGVLVTVTDLELCLYTDQIESLASVCWIYSRNINNKRNPWLGNGATQKKESLNFYWKAAGKYAAKRLPKSELLTCLRSLVVLPLKLSRQHTDRRACQKELQQVTIHNYTSLKGLWNEFLR